MRCSDYSSDYSSDYDIVMCYYMQLLTIYTQHNYNEEITTLLTSYCSNFRGRLNVTLALLVDRDRIFTQFKLIHTHYRF